MEPNLNNGDIFIVSGDFNADEDSRTIRFFSGLDLSRDRSKSTYWIDAWKVCGENQEARLTSEHNKGVLGPTTAGNNHILYPELLPSRRIDYILTYVWTYGKPGCAIDFGKFGGPLEGHSIELSDHYGIWADILIE